MESKNDQTLINKDLASVLENQRTRGTFNYAWFVGFFVSEIVYWLLMNKKSDFNIQPSIL